MARHLYHVVNALAPADNAFAGTVETKVINLKNFAHVSFLVVCGAGATGTAQITVEACSDTTPTETVAIPFYFQECVAGDTFGTFQQSAATGFTTAAAADKVYKVEVDDQFLAQSGFNYVRLKSTEVVAGTIIGTVVAILTEARFESEVFDSALV